VVVCRTLTTHAEYLNAGRAVAIVSANNYAPVLATEPGAEFAARYERAWVGYSSAARAAIFSNTSGVSRAARSPAYRGPRREGRR